MFHTVVLRMGRFGHGGADERPRPIFQNPLPSEMIIGTTYEIRTILDGVTVLSDSVLRNAKSLALTGLAWPGLACYLV